MACDFLTAPPRIGRRAWIVAAAATLGGCAGLPFGGERIVEIASGRRIDPDALLAAMRGADYALLGELHDNPLHHRLRGRLLTAMGAASPVVAEHLTRGRRAVFGANLERALAEAGFDAKGWGWPVHEPLFAAAERAGLSVAGGNLERDAARRIAREGRDAVAQELLAVVDAAPLHAAADAALRDDLVRGHCGRLGGRLLENMVLAQRSRDAAMALALREARQGAAGPALLLAGNGHVRTDYGVPQLLAGLAPGARVVAVGFHERERDAERAYTHLWLTPAVEREDPCKNMPPLQTPASPPAAAPGVRV